MTKPNPLPTLERLNELFVYHADIGEVSWRKSSRRGKKTKYAGCLDKSSGYRRVRVDGILHVLHRIIWKMETGKDPVLEIDHVKDQANNRFSNLREATSAQNKWNASRKGKGVTPLRGVTKTCYSKWIAQIACSGKKVYIGSFDTAELAHEAYRKKAEELHGEFARHD